MTSSSPPSTPAPADEMDDRPGPGPDGTTVATPALPEDGAAGAAGAAGDGFRAPPSPPPDGDLRTDISALARGGVLNLVGALSNGVFTFLFVVVLSHIIDPARVGAFMVAIAIFSILTTASQLGSQAGLVRMIPRYRVLGRVDDLRNTLAVGLWPVVPVAAALGGMMYLKAPELTNLFGHGENGAATLPYIRFLAPFVPVAAVYMSAVAATQGFGTMVPAAVVDKILRPLGQVVLLVVIGVLVGSGALALAWGLPIAAGLVVTVVWLSRLLHRCEQEDGGGSAPPRPRRRIAREYWRFTAPRGVSSLFQQAILWLDTLLIGALRSTREAGIYSVATRYLVVGTFAVTAVLQVMGPKLSEVLARGRRDRAQSVYQTSTWWLMLLVWPAYITLAIFGPVLLRIFGHGFVEGRTALLILALAMLVSAGCGPVDTVLLMAGKSSWGLVNWGVALVVNVVLNLLLIPRLGINGAAIAWMVAILVRNIGPLIQIWLFMGLHPFGRGFWTAMAAIGFCFGALGLLVRAVGGLSFPTLVVFAGTSVPLYGFLLWRFREVLNVPTARDLVVKR